MKNEINYDAIALKAVNKFRYHGGEVMNGTEDLVEILAKILKEELK